MKFFSSARLKFKSEGSSRCPGRLIQAKRGRDSIAFRFLTQLLFAACSLVSISWGSSSGEVPQSFTYQGRFYTGGGGSPLSDVVDLTLGIRQLSDAQCVKKIVPLISKFYF